MDPEAARRARQKKIKLDLLDAFDDDEASPPEWVDIILDTDERIGSLREQVAGVARRFIEETDIRSALHLREQAEAQFRAEVEAINDRVRRLNLIAPHERFHRPLLDAATVVQPLYRARRRG